VAYRAAGRQYDYVPSDAALLAQCEPVYVELPGWRQPTSAVKRWKDLPAKTRAYLKALSDLTGAPIGIASVGPGREQTIFVK
jgi:adenylosuccinate synthase